MLDKVFILNQGQTDLMKTVSFIFLLVCGLLLTGSHSVNAQCTNKVVLEKVKPSKNNPGEFVLKLQSNTSVTAQLFELMDLNEKLISTERTSSSSVSFSKIDPNAYYKIVVEFEGENSFLCRKKVFTLIRLTE